MKKYRMTYIVRILTAFILIPIGVFLILCGIDPGSKNTSAKEIALLYGFGVSALAVTLFVWIYHAKRQVVMSSKAIAIHSLFGERTIEFKKGIRFFHESINSGGLGVPFGVVGALTQAAIETQGQAATTNIKVLIKSETVEISLNSNIKGIEELRSKLIDVEAEVLFPSLENEYKNGNMVGFGEFSLRQGVLYKGKSAFKLSDLAPIKIEERKIVIRKVGGKKILIKSNVGSFENMYSFLKLVESNKFL